MQKLNQSAPKVEPGIHLNIGCGDKYWDGFVNIDFKDNWCKIKPDIACDIRKIDLPDDYADSAYAIHVIEHFHRWEAESVLREWIRVLKPGGKMILELPCLDKIIGLANHYIGLRKPLDPRMVMFALYGDPIYENPDMMHKWSYTRHEFTKLMMDAGFSQVEYQEPRYHVQVRDMRMIGTK